MNSNSVKYGQLDKYLKRLGYTLTRAATHAVYKKKGRRLPIILPLASTYDDLPASHLAAVERVLELDGVLRPGQFGIPPTIYGGGTVLLIVELDPEGCFVVSSPLIPELLTSGSTVHELMMNVRNALAIILDLYAMEAITLPSSADRDQVAIRETSERKEGRALVVLDNDSEGRYVASSPVFPELITGGETIREVVGNLCGALDVILDLYQTEHREVSELVAAMR